MSPGIPPLSFKVPLVGCRFYSIVGGFLLVAVLATFASSYVQYPGARDLLVCAFLKHYLPMALLVVVAAFGLWRFWVYLDR